MKVRNGFVSNSSSSTFLIFGRLVDIYDANYSDVEELCRVANMPESQFNELIVHDYWRIMEILETRLGQKGITVLPGEYQMMIGVGLVGDDVFKKEEILEAAVWEDKLKAVLPEFAKECKYVLSEISNG